MNWRNLKRRNFQKLLRNLKNQMPLKKVNLK